MDLTKALSVLAARRPHVLLVEVPGYGLVRMLAEQELYRRGWVESSSPADSDILLTCGVPGKELEEILDGVWDQLPGPRVRAGARHLAEIAGELDRAREFLLEHNAQHEDASTRSPAVAAQPSDSGTKENHDGMNHEGMDHGTGHDSMNHEGMDHGTGHDSMNHGDMGTPMPGGIGLAEGGSDRDGLDLDVLHVSLGPVLRYWPAGLVVRCALQGDVITEATIEVLSAAPLVDLPDVGEGSGSEREAGSDGARQLSARYCDQAASVLALMGWERFSWSAFRIRDGLLEGMPLNEAASELDVLRRRVGRSRVLRWSFRDVPEVLERLDGLFGAARAALEPGVGSGAGEPPAGEVSAGVQGVPDSVVGLDVFAARLVIASLGLVTAAASRVEAGNG